MTKKGSSPSEDPSDRFRRLLDESEETEKDITSPSSSSGEEADREGESRSSRHPTGEPDLTGGWYAEINDSDLEEEETIITSESGDETLKRFINTTNRHESTESTSEHISFESRLSRSESNVGLENTPLPRPIEEVDRGATQVSSAAYPASAEDERLVSPRTASRLEEQKPFVRRIDWGKGFGCLLRMSILGIFIIIPIILCLGSIGLYQYYTIARELPSVEDLRQRSAQFETTRIIDRNGNVLYEILDPTAGRRTYVPLEKISPYMVAATIATEDKDFYSHPGFDITAVIRAFWQNFQSGGVVSGASTITQQLARTLLFSPEERSRRTSQRKLNEVILAVEITRRYTKDEILEIYLNENYYGNLAYGVEAAAQTYFGVSADKLTLSQATFLAGLPQAPSVYDIYSNREVTLGRQKEVLVLIYQASEEQGCIYVSNNPQPICVDASSAAIAASEMKDYTFKSPDIEMRYPHWVNYVRSLLEDLYNPQTIYRSGFSVYTTLDPGLQDAAQKIVHDQVVALADKRASNGSLVAINPTSGEILAMVGSADFYDEDIDGQVNMAVSPRQPGSAIKPLTYISAFEKGWTPATLLWDVPSEFPPSGDPNDPRPPYKPVNYDERFHGPVTVRSALANSYNVPAVKALQFTGIYDNPETPEEDGLVSMARRLGITTLNRDDYGLSLTLGGGDVTLLELSGAYATFANGGRLVVPFAISRIEDHLGQVVYEYDPPVGEQVIRPDHAFLVSSILSDNQARTPAFGPDSVLNLPFPSVAKTGTTNDFRDNWTIGYTPDVVVGVWVGNADYTPMQNTSGLTGAAPIWASFMSTAIQQLTGNNPSPFIKPAGIVERVICSVSGTEPSQWCPNQRSEYFAADQLPHPKTEDLWQKILVDTWTGFLASPDCSEYSEEVFSLNVNDPWAVKWIEESGKGRAWADDMGFSPPIFFTPSQECKQSDPRPILDFSSPNPGELIINSPIEIYGQVDATATFQRFFLEYGLGDDPIQWERLHQQQRPIPQPDEIYSWDVSELPAGKVTIRLYMVSTKDTYAEKRMQLNLQVPTPTPTPTNTPTPTLTPTPTPTPTITPSQTPTPTLTETPTPKLPKATKPITPTPTDTPTTTP